MNRFDRRFTSFLRILNRLDGDALFQSTADIARVLSAFKQAEQLEAVERNLFKTREQLREALSKCEGKARYNNKQDAYKKAQNGFSVYWCRQHECWHLATKQRKKESN